MLTRTTAILLLTVINFVSAWSQLLRRPVAAPYTSFGAYSYQHVDVFSFTFNQAALAQLSSTSAGVYGERRFLLNELGNYTGVVGLVTHSGNFGIKAGYSGFSDYNETQAGFAYARQLGKKADIGVQFNYNGIRVAGYGDASAVSFEVGGVFHISDKLHTGFHVNNPVGGKFGKDQQEKLPSVYSAGIGYEASQNFFFSASIVKEEDQPVNVDAGLQYQFFPQLMARAGVSTATSSYWFGLGLSFKSFRLDVTSSFHPLLGITPGLLLLFNIKKPADDKQE